MRTIPEARDTPNTTEMKNILTLHRRFSIHPDRRKELLFHLVSWLYIALYAYTAIEKIIAHARFETTLRHSVLIGDFAGFVSWAVPITELAICVLLVLPWMQRLGLWAATGLMGLFTLYIGYMLLFAEKLTCECGGFISDLSWQQHLVFNLVFILLGAYALYGQYRPKKFN